MREGEGVQLWADGSKYVGQWKNNQANGKGTLMGMFMKVIGLMIKLMELVCISIRMVLNMLANGEMISKMVLEFSNGLTDSTIKANIKMVLSQEKEF